MTTATAEHMTDAEFRNEFLCRAELPEMVNVVTVVDEYVATRDKTLAAAIKLGIGDKGMDEIKAKASYAFVKRWMMLKFATVDLSFTERQWWLKLERNSERDIKVTAAYGQEPAQEEYADFDPAHVIIGCVNRFFEITQDLHEFAFNGLESTSATQKAGWFGPSRKKGAAMRGSDVSVTAAVPDGIGSKQMDVARVALSHYHMAIAMLYARGVDLVREVTGERSRWHNTSEKTLSIIWSPNREVLTATLNSPRPFGDPAIVLDLYGQKYLLDFYDTPDEAPITNLIREFSEGKLPKM